MENVLALSRRVSTPLLRFSMGVVLLFLGIGVRYVGLLLVGMFAGTLTIFLIAPAVSYGEAGFPNLSLAGEFLLKDLVLLAVGVALAGMDQESR